MKKEYYSITIILFFISSLPLNKCIEIRVVESLRSPIMSTQLYWTSCSDDKNGEMIT